MKEIEVKLPFASASVARERLERLGAMPKSPREFEDNRVFDREDGSLVARGFVLRLRTTGDRALLTLKVPVKDKRKYKIREEHETAVEDADATHRVLDRLGFTPCYRYQKYRSTFSLGDLSICLDETPVGCFVELEGPPEEIDRAAERLGFTPGQYVLDSYRTLHERDALRRGVPAGDLLMDPEPDVTR